MDGPATTPPVAYRLGTEDDSYAAFLFFVKTLADNSGPFSLLDSVDYPAVLGHSESQPSGWNSSTLGSRYPSQTRPPLITCWLGVSGWTR
jgi:hypothetical protein